MPSPAVYEMYRALGQSPPRVEDWHGPSPQSRVSGTRNILVIRIDFSDAAGTQTQAYYNDLIFGTTTGKMKHYYSEVSYGLITIAGTVTANWLRSSKNMAWWGADSVWGIDDANGPIFELAREAVVLADSVFNFAPYDTDNNGVITASELSLCIVHAGNGQESSGVSTDIWSHRWYIFGLGYAYNYIPLSDTFVDGKRISKHPSDDAGGYFMQAETSPMGVFAHEFGHDLGLPDLYDTDYSSDGIGYWGLMGAGSWLGSPAGSSPAHPIGWSKARLGWISPTTVSSGSNIPVKQIETYQSQSLYKLTITSTEYFLIENRQQTGYDSYLPGSGMLIWHIDDSKTDNDNDADRWVDLEEAHGGTQNLDDGADGNYGDTNDPFFSPQKTSFADGTDPNSNTKVGSSSGIGVVRIGTSGMTMTFSLSGKSWVSGTYLAVVEVGDSWSSGPHGDQYTTSTSFAATQEQVTILVGGGESLLLLGSAQLWNGRSDVGTSIAIFRDGSRISGDMFAVGATMGHRGAATAIAIDTPGAGSFTYSLRFKTDPSGTAWVSATYLLAVKILSSQSSGPTGDQSTASTSFTPTAESVTVSGSGGTMLLLVASSQIWNGRSDVGSSISIYRDDTRISGDMFAVGAVASHRNIAVGIAIDTVPDNGYHTYSLRFKTDPGGTAWVSATYLALIPISAAYSSGPTGDQSTTSLSFTNTQETIPVSSTSNKYLVIGSSQLWNDYPSIGSSICILRDGVRISGDMFTSGAYMGHRHVAVAIAVDQPGTGTFTYALAYKTD